MKIMRKQQFPQEFWKSQVISKPVCPGKPLLEVGEKERWRRKMEENGSSRGVMWGYLAAWSPPSLSVPTDDSLGAGTSLGIAVVGPALGVPCT